MILGASGWALRAAWAGEDVTVESIMQSLKKRSISAAPSENTLTAARRFEELRKIKNTRGLNFQEREELYGLGEGQPQTDLIVYFDLDFAEITQQAVPVLKTLGQALTREELGGSFVINGHTDRRGSADYNQSLSERRAEAVKQYLVERFKIEPDTLTAVGLGFQHLKRPDAPLADENRRVEIVNMTR